MLIRPAGQLLRRNSALVFRRNATSYAQDVKDLNKWRTISIVSFFPMIGIPLYVNHMDPEDHSPPEYIEYEHLRIRTKQYKWRNGDQSLLHNAETNPEPKLGGFSKEYHGPH